MKDSNISAMQRNINNFVVQTINVDRARRLFSLVQANNLIPLYKKLSARLCDTDHNEKKQPGIILGRLNLYTNFPNLQRRHQKIDPGKEVSFQLHPCLC